jgi:DNA-binding Lrp family transcriptional regulator
MDMRAANTAFHALPVSTLPMDKYDTRLLAEIQHGIPLSPRPFLEIGARIGLSEAQVIARLEELSASGIIKRFGVIVRHHELGYRANAMVVWDVPDEIVAALGRCLSKFEFITLCYRRARRLPEWRYNLYCMIHGRDRETVLEKIAFLIKACGIECLSCNVLFSNRRFKQRGAVFSDNGNVVPIAKRMTGG